MLALVRFQGRQAGIILHLHEVLRPCVNNVRKGIDVAIQGRARPWNENDLIIRWQVLWTVFNALHSSHRALVDWQRSHSFHVLSCIPKCVLRDEHPQYTVLDVVVAMPANSTKSRFRGPIWASACKFCGILSLHDSTLCLQFGDAVPDKQDDLTVTIELGIST